MLNTVVDLISHDQCIAFEEYRMQNVNRLLLRPHMKYAPSQNYLMHFHQTCPYITYSKYVDVLLKNAQNFDFFFDTIVKNKLEDFTAT